MSRKVEEYMNA